MAAANKPIVDKATPQNPAHETTKQCTGLNEEGTIWHSRPLEEVLQRLGVPPRQGLYTADALQRLERYGANELSEKPRPNFWQRLLCQFTNLMVLLLIGACCISAALGEWPEAAAILLIVFLNAGLGVVQEGRAEQALASLSKLAAPDATVRRNSRICRVPAGNIVPGDIVLLEAGGFVPADLRLIEAHNLKIDEATLTGESNAVLKEATSIIRADAPLGDRHNMAYKSTTVTYGRGEGIVVGTGMATEIGSIACLLQNAQDEPTPLQKRLDELGRTLVYCALAICAAIFLLTLYRETAKFPGGLVAALQEPVGRALLRRSALEAFLTAIALAIAAVPEGLPAIVTVNLALGMREMVRRHAIIRRLHAVETLGSVSVICSDKTGTLTQNEMTVVRLHTASAQLDVSGSGYAPQGEFLHNGQSVTAAANPEVAMLLMAALLSSDARLETSEETAEYRIVGDPTEGALVVAAIKAGMQRTELEARYPRINETPFDATRKRMSTLHLATEAGAEFGPEADHLLFVKGAPDVVLERCSSVLQDGLQLELTPAHREHVKNLNRNLAQQALRVIAVAFRRIAQAPQEIGGDEESNLTLLGLLAMQDAPRREAAEAIEKARQAGIRTVMITGDYPDTAHAIAMQVGLAPDGGRVVTGEEIEKASDEDLTDLVGDVSIFARVSPTHKLRIAQALRRRGAIVAMTGDGVNDAPALKGADIGVAMGITGADVTKETADMVLTDDNFASIVGAVEQGRIIYSNIRKFVAFLLGCNLAEIAIILVATCLGYPNPLTPLQILWLNLITDGAPALALGMEKGDSDVMNHSPRPAKEPIINRRMQVGIGVQTITIAAVTLTMFFITLRTQGLAQARTHAFVTLSLVELLVAYTYRSERIALVKLGFWGNRALQYAVGISLILLLVVVYLPFLQPVFSTFPLTLRHWLQITLLALLPPLAAELTKWGLHFSHDNDAPPGQHHRRPTTSATGHIAV